MSIIMFHKLIFFYVSFLQCNLYYKWTYVFNMRRTIRLNNKYILNCHWSGGQDNLRTMLNNARNHIPGNPRLPPFPHPVTVYPLVQIRQTLSIPGLGGSGTGSSSAVGAIKNKGVHPTQATSDIMCLATCFARRRGWVANSPTRDLQGIYFY